MTTLTAQSQPTIKKVPTQWEINAMRARAAQPPFTSIGSVGNYYTRSPGGREGKPQ